MIDEQPPAMAEYDAVCHTADCPNEGVAIHTTAPAEGPIVICGPCSQAITDLTPASV